MTRIWLALGAALLLAVPATAADIETLSKNAAEAAAKALQGAFLCQPVLGDSAVAGGRAVFEQLLQIGGKTGDDLTIAEDDAEQQAKAFVAKQAPVRSLIGKNGVTEANVQQSCTEILNAAIHDADVALARLRKAAGK